MNEAVAAAPASTLERSVQKVFVRDQLTSSVIGHAKKKINIIIVHYIIFMVAKMNI